MSANDALNWWEIVTGILSIPTTLIGLAYSYALIKKTRQESKLKEIEILEKQQKIRDFPDRRDETVREIVEPLVRGRQVQYLLIRYVLLELIMRLYSFVVTIYSFINQIIFFSLAEATDYSIVENIWFRSLSIITSYLPSVGTYLILFAIGIPLIKDANEFIGLDVRDLFKVKWRDLFNIKLLFRKNKTMKQA